MLIEEALYTALGSLVSGRVFPDVAPLDTPRPYITYQQIGGDAHSYIGKELPDHEHALVQINIWADTRLQAAALRKLAEASLIAATAFEARPAAGPISQHEPDLTPPGYGTQQDFDIWTPR